MIIWKKKKNYRIKKKQIIFVNKYRFGFFKVSILYYLYMNKGSWKEEGNFNY